MNPLGFWRDRVMKYYTLFAASLVLGLAGIIPAANQGEHKVQILVRVAARDLGSRKSDQMPAEYRLTATDLPKNRHLDPGTLRVFRWDDKKNKPVGTPLPLRWYDDSIPYDFPDCEQNVHATNGLKLTFTNRPRWGDYYNLLGDGAGGRLVWTHTQEGNQPALYAVTFQLTPPGQPPMRLAPRDFVGDGSHRCAPLGATSTGMIHSRVAAVDWDGDGLIDLLVGGVRGHILFYRNLGDKTKPQYGPPRLVMTADGKPLDSGWCAAPCAVDWDGDGVTDLLVGCERNRVLFYRNEGTNRDPRLVNKGFVMVGDSPLELPTQPVPKSPKGVYQLDYYPVLEAVDWNGDGQLDLLAGGYITGRVYYFENVGKLKDGSPRLAARGPLESDGKVLNVGDWAAAPCAADFDGDGDLDLICGNMPLNEGGGDHVEASSFLRYYENVGTRKEPRLVQRPFPKKGVFPQGALATPRAVDLNGDGLLDLVVSANEGIYLFFNIGARGKPLFAVHDQPLPSEWGSAPLPFLGLQFLDYNGDGRLDLLSGLTIYLNRGEGKFEGASLLAPGNKIEHAGAGDGWIFTQLADFDGDGEYDLVYGTHAGNLWVHRNLGGKPARFDEKGELLKTDNGKPIQVGPLPGKKMDFDVLQGARTTFSIADFDGDGLLDLVVGDTYGKVRYYRNTGTKQSPKFAAPVEIGAMPIRMTPYAADWDGDGKPDVIGSCADGKVWWWRNLGGGRFDKEKTIRMPEVCYSPMVAVVDWNQDGDQDLLVGTANGYTCWFDRSFLDHGYAVARRVD